MALTPCLELGGVTWSPPGLFLAATPHSGHYWLPFTDESREVTQLARGKIWILSHRFHNLALPPAPRRWTFGLCFVVFCISSSASPL